MKTGINREIYIKGYRIVGLIREKGAIKVYRAIRQADNKSVFLKFVDIKAPLRYLLYLRQEYNVLKSLHLKQAPRVYDLTEMGTNLVLVLEDSGIEQLKHYLSQFKLSLDQFFKIAIQLAEALDNVHKEHIIHKTLTSHNIGINKNFSEITIYDFTMASKASEGIELLDTNFIEGNLDYISPEQTGRINRLIDYRSDLYSLGIILYEMLIGHPPFETNDTLEMIHAQIAKTPVPPHVIDPNIPEMVSLIVMKLLEKSPELRYQSALGLKFDLKRCLKQWEKDKIIEHFPLGSYRYIYDNTLQISKLLYGREQETARLEEAFHHVVAKRSGLVFVSGYSGIGKSTFVKEIQRLVVTKRGYFIWGKFDQFELTRPYLPFIDAFKKLINQILTESNERLEVWKNKLKKALGNNNAEVLINLIPDLKVILGPQPQAPKLNPEEAGNHFNYLMRAFIRTFAQKKHPLVLFLDDAQWGDLASLNLIQTLMTTDNIKHLMIICAYRDNEITASSPLMLAINKLKNTGVPIEEIHLTPLKLDHVNQLIQDSLKDVKKDTSALAQLIFNKTEGNPFFIIEFLKKVYRDHLLFFDKNTSDWKWDINRITDMFYSDNVADLVASQISLLPDELKTILKIAACIGTHFDIETIYQVSKLPLKELIASLEKCLNEGFIIRVGNINQLLLSLDEQDTKPVFHIKIEYFFLHDKVHQAAYQLLSDEEKKQIHFRIAQTLLKGQRVENIGDKLFDITNHYNLSDDLIRSKGDRQLGAELNLFSGIKAKSSSAYDVAREYFAKGIQFLDKDCWKTQYELTFSLQIEKAESEYLCNLLQQAEEQLNNLLHFATNKTDTVKIYYLLNILKSTQGNYQEAFDFCCKALDYLNITVPPNIEQANIEFEKDITKINSYLSKHTITDILHLPEMQDPNQQLIIKILVGLWAPLINLKPYLAGWHAAKATRISLEHGNAPDSAYAYLYYGLILCADFQYKEGYEFSAIAIKLVNLYGNLSLKPQSYMMYGAQTGPWRNPFDKCIEFLEEAYGTGLQSGNYLWGGYAVHHIILQHFMKATSLNHVLNVISSYRSFLEKKRDPHVYTAFQPYERILLALSGKTQHPLSFDDKDFDEAGFLATITKHNYVFSLGTYFIVKIQLAFLFSQYETGLKFAKEAEKYVPAFQQGSWPIIVDFYFYKSLCLASIYEDETISEQRQIKSELEKNTALLKLWADNCKANFEDKYLIIAAMYAEINNNPLDATELFNKAIETTIINGFALNQAIAYEMTSKFYSQIDKDKSKQYLTNAHLSYKTWGASTKVEALEKIHPFLKHVSTMKIDSEIRNHQTPVIDSLTLIKATNAISSEIHFDKLLIRLLEILIQSAGAKKGILLLNVDNVLTIKAIGELDHKINVQLESTPMAAYKSIPASVINYVNNTQKPLVLNNALHANNFNYDNYIVSNHVYSILCAPIISQSQLRGIIYLENKTAPHTFTTERYELITMLATQIAISLQNALLYEELHALNEHLEQLVTERTRELTTALANFRFTQRQLLETEKMAALGTLVAGISHEINTPIGIGALAATHLVDKQKYYFHLYQTNQLTRSHIDDFFNLINESSILISNNLNRAGQLIKSFKEIAIDQSTGVKRTFLVKEYIQNVLTNLTPKLKNTKLKIEINCDDNLQILSFPGEFSQLITNLVMNSIIHAFDEGEEGLLVFNVKKQNNEIIFEYSDNGKGIKPEYMPRIFEPFFTTKFGHGGSGLGLNIVYNIVTKKLHGKIKCESTLGKGTKFIIQFPIEG